MTTADTRQPVDDQAIKAAKTIMRTARHGALSTLDPASGAPLASRVSLATLPDGAPVFLISRLADHFGALDADARCSLLMGEPGKGDPLAHPRVSITGLAIMLDGEDRNAARTRFLSRHPKAELYADFGDFAFWSMQIERAAYYGGFAKAYDMTGADILAPTAPDLTAMEPGAVEHMNEDHADAIKHYAEGLCGAPAGDWQLATLDLEGLDLVDGDQVARLWFDPPLRAAADLRARLVALAKVA